MAAMKSPMVAEKALLGSPLDIEAALDAISTRPSATKCLTAREMEAIVAASDTLLPSIHFPGGSHDDAIDTFYQTSASMTGTPEIVCIYQFLLFSYLVRITIWRCRVLTAYDLGGLQVGEYIAVRMRHALRWLLRLSLWLLSTWYGTFFLCWTQSLTTRFPFFLKFSEIDAQRREVIMFGWANSCFYLYRLLFRALKFMVILFHFTQVTS